MFSRAENRGNKNMGTLKTWKASNWMLGLLSLSRFIMSFRFSGLLMYRVMTVKLCLSRSSSPSSCPVNNTHKHDINDKTDDRNHTSERTQTHTHAPSATVSWSRSSRNEAVSHSYRKPGKEQQELLNNRSFAELREKSYL